MENKKGISKLSAQLKSKLSLAYLDAVLQGSPAPLADFYSTNEAVLKNNYGISLNQILNIDKEDLGKVRNIKLKNPAIDNSQENAESNIQIEPTESKDKVEKKEPTNEASSFDWIYPVGGLIAAGTGIYLIYKSLKK